MSVACAALIGVSAVYGERSYDIAELYEAERPARGTKAVGRHGRTTDVEYILRPIRLEKGKMVVEVKKIGDNLYLIKGSDICVETRGCYQLTSFAEQVVVIIESNYGYKKGVIIFE